MALSGNIAFDLTAGQLIEYAFRKLNVISASDPILGSLSEQGRIELNVMLKSWMKYEWLWKTPEQSVTLIADQVSYVLSPRPYRVINCRFKTATGSEIPMFRYTQEEYDELPLKTTPGPPTQFYPDRQRTQLELFTWPVINSVTTETLEIRYQAVFEDVDVITEDVDVRQEHLDLVGYNLAKRLADDHGQSDEVTGRVIREADRLLEEARDNDREAVVRFVPERRMHG